MSESSSAPESWAFRDKPVSFVRRGGRMSEAQDRAWEELAPRYLLDVVRGPAETSVAPGSEICLADTFGREAPLIVEIGSGQGHAIVHAGRTRPEVNFLAVEVFRAGLARTMLNADREGVDNIRLVEANAPEVLQYFLPEASVQELWVFFPDPWHKNKHTKRRLVTAEFAEIARGALQPGGIFRMATDWEDYAVQMRNVLDQDSGFEREFEENWAPRFEGRVLTAFEQKGARVGRSIRDLSYRRTGSL